MAIVTEVLHLSKLIMVSIRHHIDNKALIDKTTQKYLSGMLHLLHKQIIRAYIRF